MPGIRDEPVHTGSQGGLAAFTPDFTNVREDGTIPQFEKPHWLGLNTFRTQAQIQNGGTCQPPPPG